MEGLKSQIHKNKLIGILGKSRKIIKICHFSRDRVMYN